MPPIVYALAAVVFLVAGGCVGIGLAQKEIEKGIIPRWKMVLPTSLWDMAMMIFLFFVFPMAWIRIMGGVVFVFFPLGILSGFAERRKSLKKTLRIESVIFYTFENGNLTEGILPDRCDQLRFSCGEKAIAVPFHYRNEESALTNRGVLRYDAAAFIRDGECAALPMTSLHQGYILKDGERFHKASYLVRIKTRTPKWGRINGQPFIVEGSTGIVRGDAILVSRAKELIHNEWEPSAEDCLWLLRDDAIIYITDTSGAVFVIWMDKNGIESGRNI